MLYTSDSVYNTVQQVVIHFVTLMIVKLHHLCFPVALQSGLSVILHGCSFESTLSQGCCSSCSFRSLTCLRPQPVAGNINTYKDSGFKFTPSRTFITFEHSFVKITFKCYECSVTSCVLFFLLSTHPRVYVFSTRVRTRISSVSIQ